MSQVLGFVEAVLDFGGDDEAMADVGFYDEAMADFGFYDEAMADFGFNDEAMADVGFNDEAMADVGFNDEHAVEQAQGLLSSIMDANTPIETVEIDMYESMDVPNDKVLLDMTSVVPFVLHIGAWAELMQSVLDSQTNKHVIKLGFPACLTRFGTIRCVPTQEEDAGQKVVLTCKEAIKDDIDTLRTTSVGLGFVWKHDGAYLASFGGLIGPLFTPYIPSRDYTREEIKSRCGNKLVFFRFEDDAPA